MDRLDPEDLPDHQAIKELLVLLVLLTLVHGVPKDLPVQRGVLEPVDHKDTQENQVHLGLRDQKETMALQVQSALLVEWALKATQDQWA